MFHRGVIKINLYGKPIGAMAPTPPLSKVIENKREKKTLLLNNFKFFIESVSKYQLILYGVKINITKVSYTIIYHFFHLFI
jgi:hypothetical protein